jgi:hypothetical protein
MQNYLKNFEKFDLAKEVEETYKIKYFYKLKNSFAILPYGRIGRIRAV